MAASMNDNHRRRLLLTFEHVDNLLNTALQSMAPAEAPSPFQRCLPDALPVQQKVIGDYIARLRAMMVRDLASQGIAVPKPQISSLWSFQAALLLARTDVEELAPRYMRGYGELSDDDVHKLEVVTTQMLEVFDRMSSYLARGAGQDLQARLERLEKTTREVELAKVLEQVIATHGIIELRLSLDAVIERLESSRFEIAVFGRVSSGKSSLLNHILRTDVLPVGVTPVTAIPTRIMFGKVPLARIWFAEAEPIAVELRELAQYVTEQNNFDNAKHVTCIQAELPADRLKEGVVFVDTPGLGSLARYGEMESMAYLPRCDLGIVLVDASSTLIQEDAVVINAIRQAGAEVMVLLTKADILDPGDRHTAAQYVANQLRANLGFDVPVHVVSVKGADSELCDRWFETILMPCLREHGQLAKVVLRRKVGLLKEAVIATLRHRLEMKSVASGDLAGKWKTVEPALNDALVKLETVMREQTEWPGLSEKIVNAAAQEMVDEWRRNAPPQIDAGSKLISCGSKEVNRVVADVAKYLATLREQLRSALRDAATAVGSNQEEATDIPALAGLPVLDIAASLQAIPLPMHRPVLTTLLKGLSCRIIRAQLTSRSGQRLTSLLDQYVRQVHQWRLQVLTDMRRSFMAKVDFFRVQCQQTPDKSDLPTIERDLKRLEVYKAID